jgi:plastocyanin
MRIHSTWIGLLAALALSAAPAEAANQTVVASSTVFTPADVTVVQGDSVTWNNGGGPHNVRFDDGSFEIPADPDPTPWSVTRTFNTVGVFRYYCENHGSAGGVGMAGAVYVQAAGTTPPPPGTTVFADKTAPALRLSGSTRQKVLRQRAVSVRATVDEAANLVARGWVSIPGRGKILRTKRISRQVAARATSKLSLKLSGPALKAFRRALRKHTRLTARITVTARDQAGNRAVAKRRVKLKK